MDRRTRTISITMSALFAVALIAAGCGDDDTSTSSTPAATEATEAAGEEGGAGETIDTKIGEWFIRPAVDSVKAGEVTFKVKNVGKVEHEFIVLKTDDPADDLPLNGQEVDLSAAGEVVGGAHEPGEEEEGEEEEGASEEHEAEEHLQPGETQSYEVDMEPGSYVLICNIPGHYGMGQYAEFTVE